MPFIEQILNGADSSWHEPLKHALATMDARYLASLSTSSDWLPGATALLNAFSLPFSDTRFILYGESPYPRAASANGYAFWDAAVTTLWAPTGLSVAVNRATSLRNFIKMLLVADGALNPSDTSAAAIARLDKSAYWQTLTQLFTQLKNQGFLLLNASLVLSQRPKLNEARLWLCFQQSILASLSHLAIPPTLVLFGKIADSLQRLPEAQHFPQLIAEHPYNLSFITNPTVITFFKNHPLLRIAA